MTANTMVSRVGGGRQEENLVQHDSVAGAGSNVVILTPGPLFEAYISTAQFGKKILVIINSIPCV